MDTIIVSDKDAVSEDDFYLSDEWLPNTDEDTMKRCRELAKAGNLYVAYEVGAVSYAIYQQMDSSQVFIDDEDNIVMWCEGAVIGNEHMWKWESA